MHAYCIRRPRLSHVECLLKFNDHESHHFLQSAIELKDMLLTKRRVECVKKFDQVSTETTEIRARFETFVQECPNYFATLETFKKLSLS